MRANRMHLNLPHPPYLSATADFNEAEFRKANRLIVIKNMTRTLLGGFPLSALIAIILSLFVVLTTIQTLQMTFLFVAGFSLATGLLWPFAVIRNSIDNYAKQLRQGTLTVWLSESHIFAGNSTSSVLRCFPFNDTTIYTESPEFFVLQCGSERLIVMRSALQKANIENLLREKLRQNPTTV